MSAVLSNIEAARISAILQEATEKLSFLGSITPDVVACRDELLRTVGDEVTRGIGAQRVLERRYEELVAQRSSLKALSNKAKYDENQQHLKEAAHALRESTKQLCQKLKGSPNIGENLSQMQAKRSNLQNLLSITLQELRSNSFETLAEATAEEKARTDKIADAISREEERSSRIHGLREDLISLREVNAQDLEGKTNAIEKLKKELWDERKNSAINLKYLQKEATARGESLSRTHSHTICELEKRVRSLQRDLDVEARASEETRRFLQRKQESLARDAQAWKQRWKAEVEEDDQLEKLKAERAVGLAKLCEYRERYRKEMARIAQEKAEAEAEARKRQEDERNASAATKVQSVWRGHHVRTGGRGKKVKDKVGKQGKGGKAGKKGTGGKGAKKAKGNTKSHSATAKLKQNPKQKPVKTNKVTVKKNASKT